MAIPEKLATVVASSTGSKTWANHVKELTDWFRSTRPVYRGTFRADADGFRDFEVASDSEAVWGGGDSSGNPYETFNQGGWTSVNTAVVFTVGALLTPETGIYRMALAVEYESDANGRRRSELLVNGGLQLPMRSSAEAVSGGKTLTNATALIALTEADELTVLLYQDSGSALDCVVTLSAHWVAPF